MNKFLLLVFLLVGASEAELIVFKPDTVRAGYGSSASLRFPVATTATNTSGSITTIQLKRLITPFKHTKKRISFIAQNSRAYVYQIDSTIPYGSRFIQHLSRDTSSLAFSISLQQSYSTYKAPEIQLASNGSVVLNGFRLEDCQAYIVRAMANSAAPTTLCSDEPVDLIFETRPTGTDTLHLRVGQWSLGVRGTPHSGNPGESVGAGYRYSLDGKARSEIRSNEIRDIGTFAPTTLEE